MTCGLGWFISNGENQPSVGLMLRGIHCHWLYGTVLFLFISFANNGEFPFFLFQALLLEFMNCGDIKISNLYKYLIVPLLLIIIGLTRLWVMLGTVSHLNSALFHGICPARFTSSLKLLFLPGLVAPPSSGAI